MYYNDYEDYMRSVLGYSNTNDNTYCNSCNYGMNYNDMEYNNSSFRNTASNVEHMYPEIYRIINPMVCKICDNNTKPVNEYLIEQMTDEIYDNVVNRVEIQNVINLNIGTREIDNASEISENRGDVKENRSSTTTSSNSNTLGRNSNISSKNSVNTLSSLKQNDVINVNSSRLADSEERETRSPQPRRNRLLRDLIRILILNRIIRPGRPGPNRPPFRPVPGYPPFGPRPPMPGGPGFGPGPRPPMPRFDEYEW